MTLKQVMDILVNKKILSNGASELLLEADELDFTLTNDFGEPTNLLIELTNLADIEITYAGDETNPDNYNIEGKGD